MKYINTYANNAAFTADINNFSYPHVGYLQAENEVKYDKDPSSLGYNIWGTVTDGTTSLSMTINGSGEQAIVNDGYFMYNWTGTVTTGLYMMFRNNTTLKTLENLSVDASNCQNARMMFNTCTNVTKVDLSSMNATSCTIFDNMFSHASKLETIIMPRYNLVAAQNIGGMFCYTKIKNVDLSCFSGAPLTTIDSLFTGCNQLLTADLTPLNTSGCTSIGEMFNGCSSLIEINMSGLDLGSISRTYKSFAGTPSLTTIYFNNTTEASFDVLKSAVMTGLEENITIYRDGYNWNYVNGQWVSTPINN